MGPRFTAEAQRALRSRREEERLPLFLLFSSALSRRSLRLCGEVAETMIKASSLKDSFDKSVAVAFGLNAIEARIENASQLREAGREVWTVTLQPEKEGHDNGIFELSMNGWSADDIAELRARRILLNEQVGGARFSAMDRLNAGLIEHNVRGENRYIGEARSPFPELYTELGNDLPYFLASARLFAVLYLRLTGTVRHVLKLDLALRDGANLDVRFEGQRPQVYANKEPRVIKVKGSCPLIGSYDDDV